jgi:4-amino-4-deoxy-L-arabinose transferase-like glycosyltransferase
LRRPSAQTPLLGLVATLVLFGRLGQGVLANYDDCYYAQKAKEMLQGGDWLTPHFAGHVRLDNPPLFLWLIAAGFTIFGVGKIGAAFCSAAAGVACVLLLPRLARRLGFDEFEAWSAGVILLTTQYFLKYAQHAMMDVVLTLFFLIALDGYLSGTERKGWGWARLGLFTGLGVLMKSVLGLFPLIVVGVHRLTVRGRRALLEPGPWIAAIAAAVVAAPWYAYQLKAHGDQLAAEHFRWLIWSRGLVDAGTEGVDNGPFGYLTRIASVYWPWLPFAVGGCWLEIQCALDPEQPAETRSSARLVLIWLVVVLGVMSVGHVKKLWYVMSVFPCLALLSARAVSRLIRSDRARHRATVAAGTVLVLFAAVVALTPLGTARERQPGLHRTALEARARVPKGEKVINLDAPYWDVANVFLFYSDHDLTEPVVDPARVREGLQRGDWALIRSGRLGDVLGPGAGDGDVAARSDDWALVKPAGARRRP